jgi:hypothetical protein
LSIWWSLVAVLVVQKLVVAAALVVIGLQQVSASHHLQLSLSAVAVLVFILLTLGALPVLTAFSVLSLPQVAVAALHFPDKQLAVTAVLVAAAALIAQPVEPEQADKAITEPLRIVMTRDLLLALVAVAALAALERPSQAPKAVQVVQAQSLL